MDNWEKNLFLFKNVRNVPVLILNNYANYTLNYIIKNSSSNFYNFLECGTGFGRIVLPLAKQFSEIKKSTPIDGIIHGFDKSKFLFNELNSNLQKERDLEKISELKLIDIEERYCYKRNFFNGIYIVSFLHWLNNWKKVLTNLIDSLSQTGFLILASLEKSEFSYMVSGQFEFVRDMAGSIIEYLFKEYYRLKREHDIDKSLSDVSVCYLEPVKDYLVKSGMVCHKHISHFPGWDWQKPLTYEEIFDIFKGLPFITMRKGLSTVSLEKISADMIKVVRNNQREILNFFQNNPTVTMQVEIIIMEKK